MQVSINKFSLDFKKIETKNEGILYYTTPEGVARKILQFTGNRFDIYKLDFLVNEKTIGNLGVKIDSMLQQFEKTSIIDTKSITRDYIDLGLVGKLSLLIEMLIETQLLVYRNNDLRYNSKVTGKLLLVRKGYNILKDKEMNYSFIQTQIIPIESLTDTEEIIKLKLGKRVGAVSFMYLFDNTVEELHLKIEDILHMYKNYN